MDIGDLVALRLCNDAGKVGIITFIHKDSHLTKSKPHLRLYRILLRKGVQCFTGNQLIQHRWMRE